MEPLSQITRRAKRGNHDSNQSQRAASSPAACTMRVVGLDSRKRVLVTAASSAQAAPARLLTTVRAEDLFDAGGVGREVLVVFDAGRQDRPIIIGVLQGENDEALPATPTGRNSTQSPEERLLIEAVTELVLKCGAGSITLRRDGKIVLRGTHLLSRASGPIRIKGGHVEIN
jgi:hypothetical protein